MEMQYRMERRYRTAAWTLQQHGVSAWVPFTVEDVYEDHPPFTVGTATSRTVEFILYRIRVLEPESWPRIKYLRAARLPDSAASSNRRDGLGKLLGFSRVPAGEWNLGYLSVLPNNNYGLQTTETVDLAEKLNLVDGGEAWCETTIELVDIIDAIKAQRGRDVHSTNHISLGTDVDADRFRPDVQCIDRLHAAILRNNTAGLSIRFPRACARHPDHDPREPWPAEVVAIWAWEPHQGYSFVLESRAYAVLQTLAPGLAPRFLGHITDDGSRIVGFLVEHVDNGRDVTVAGPMDLEKCQEALKRFHALGLSYLQLRRNSFLRTGDGTVMLHGFWDASETVDEKALARKMKILGRVMMGQLGDGKRNG